MNYIILYIEKTPLLTDAQIKMIAEIFIASGQLTAGSLVLPFIFEFEAETSFLLLFGALTTLFFWLSAVIMVKKLKL